MLTRRPHTIPFGSDTRDGIQRGLEGLLVGHPVVRDGGGLDASDTSVSWLGGGGGS